MAFKFAPTVPAGLVESARLGASPSAKFADADVGKPVKFGADTFVLATAGDAIDGFVNSIEPFTVDGYSFGGVVRNGRFYAVVETGGTTVAVGDAVEASDQAALGTAQAYPLIQKAASSSAGISYFKVISLLGGDGAATKTVLIERL